MVLNEIDNCFIGDTQMDYIYLGDILIWPSEVPPTPEPVYPYEAVYSPHDEIWYYSTSSFPAELGNTTNVIEHNYEFDMSLGYGKGVIKFNYTTSYTTTPSELFYSDDINNPIFAVYYPRDVETIGYNCFYNMPNLKRINCDTDGVAIFGGNTRYFNPIPIFGDKKGNNFHTVILGENVQTLNRYSLFLNYSKPYELYCYSRVQPRIVRSPINNTNSGTLHYPHGSDYNNMLTELGDGWTAVADL